MAAVAVYQIYFWADRVPDLNGQECSQYGFLFSKIILNNKGFQAANIVLYVLLILACAILMLLNLGCLQVESEDDDSSLR